MSDLLAVEPQGLGVVGNKELFCGFLALCSLLRGDGLAMDRMVSFSHLGFSENLLLTGQCQTHFQLLCKAYRNWTE